ncbi:MAG: DUF3488 domain-containing protein [Verrucomicrobiaceae bacterium]|nr:DUF3488 domain-containing protein [Verrucomicrobiaceae bacterium]
MKLRLRATWHTLALLTMLGAMWYAAEAQSNGAAYLLALLAGVLAVVSVLHARANLRGLSIRARHTATGREGVSSRVKVELVNGAAKPARGIEVIVEGAARGSFVDLVEPGQTRFVELPAPTQVRAGASLRLMVRSVYPLGLYSIEGVVETAGARRVHPKPSGNLPLPPAQPLSPQARLEVSDRGGGVVARGGDDFAGTREWQHGDSPRHIDWRAVARGRPLVVKTWSASQNAAVLIDWDAIALPEVARAGQIARWIEQCGQEARPFELRLPGVVIPTGTGESHTRRCLDALSDFVAEHDDAFGGAGQGNAVTAQLRRKAPATFETAFHLPHGPLLMLCAALFACFLPLWGLVALPCLVIASLCFLWRGILKLPVPHLMTRLLVLVAGVVTTWLAHPVLRSMETGIALLITLAGAKLLESRSPREFQILALIGWFLCLCGIMMDNSLMRMLWCVAAFALVTLCMVRFRHSVAGLRRPAWTTLVMFTQALPLVVVLFFVFPRGLLNLRGSGSQSGQTGISDDLDPGSLTSVALRMERAFRATFPDGRIPTPDERYWRCLTLWDCYGLRWRRGARLVPEPRLLVEKPELDLRQEIVVEPHGARWLPALDFPLRADIGRDFLKPEFDDSLVYAYSVSSPTRYTVRSRPAMMEMRSQGELHAQHREAALQLPDKLPASMRALVQQWRSNSVIDEDIVVRAQDYFRAQKFEYTLEPNDYSGPDGFEDFMLRGKKGFCEHFSASFATLMRMAGVPSRVVIGFLGGEYDFAREQMVVRQSDAHAWVEVWLERRGWFRIDPTADSVPRRITENVHQVIEENGRTRQHFGALGEMVFQARLWWDRLSYAWHDRVVDFDREEQGDWLESLGLRGSTLWQLLGISAGVFVVWMAVVVLFLRRRARHADPWVRSWQRLCQKLLRAGYPPRRACEGPLAFAARVAAGNAEITRLASLYASGRYGAENASAADFARSVREMRVK